MRTVCLSICLFFIYDVAICQLSSPQTAIKQAADGLIAKTQPAYYTTQIFNRLTQSMDPCANTLCAKGSLPVTLLDFTANRRDAVSVVLLWETSQETNNDYFELQRSLNLTDKFESIAKIQGQGSKSNLSVYKYTDANTFKVYSYYRLRQVDFDGPLR